MGADGVNGVSARALALGGNRALGVALEGNVPYADVDETRCRGRLVLEVGVLPGGYGWVFPKATTGTSGSGRGRRGPAPATSSAAPATSTASRSRTDGGSRRALARHLWTAWAVKAALDRFPRPTFAFARSPLV